MASSAPSTPRFEAWQGPHEILECIASFGVARLMRTVCKTWRDSSESHLIFDSHSFVQSKHSLPLKTSPLISAMRNARIIGRSWLESIAVFASLQHLKLGLDDNAVLSTGETTFPTTLKTLHYSMRDGRDLQKLKNVGALTRLQDLSVTWKVTNEDPPLIPRFEQGFIGALGQAVGLRILKLSLRSISDEVQQTIALLPNLAVLDLAAITEMNFKPVMKQCTALTDLSLSQGEDVYDLLCQGLTYLAQPKLRCLKIDDLTVNGRDLAELFAQAPNLQELKLLWYAVNPPHPWIKSFEKMTQLKTLSLIYAYEDELTQNGHAQQIKHLRPLVRSLPCSLTTLEFSHAEMDVAPLSDLGYLTNLQKISIALMDVDPLSIAQLPVTVREINFEGVPLTSAHLMQLSLHTQLEKLHLKKCFDDSAELVLIPENLGVFANLTEILLQEFSLQANHFKALNALPSMQNLIVIEKNSSLVSDALDLFCPRCLVRVVLQDEDQQETRIIYKGRAETYDPKIP